MKFKRLSAMLLSGVILVGASQSALAAESAGTTGFENGTGTLNLRQISRYTSGITNEDGGVMEIVDYNKQNGFAYVVNGQTGHLTAIPMNKLENGKEFTELQGNNIDIKSLVEDADFVYGDMTSVAVSPDGKTLVAAIQSEDYAANGRAALFACKKDGSLTFLQTIETGVQPDMITFTPDGNKILIANEGEPRMGYGEKTVDPAGSVTIIRMNGAKKVTKADFSHYDSKKERQALVDAGIVLKKGTAPSVDFEPEYIACNNNTAYVSLQEANAIAIVNINSGHITDICSAGFEDYSKIAVDIDKKDETYAPKTYETLRGVRMPDGISLVTIDGKDYLMTANEGDSREWNDYLNEDERNFGKGKTSPTGSITAENSGLTGKVVFFDASDYDGLDDKCDYIFGGRSFTLFQVNKHGIKEVFDSENDFEAKTAAYLPNYFNCSNDSLEIDDRSGKKGPEPETVVSGVVDGKAYAFVTLERIGGVMVYELSSDGNAKYVNYINSRNFSEDIAQDDSPEGLKFISAKDSPTGKALLLAACEVGGTVATYELTK